MSNTEPNLATVEWKDIPWRKVERIVFKLQKRIFQASQRGDSRAVRKLQKTLINSWSAKVLAVRRVTQDNQGKVRREVVQQAQVALGLRSRLLRGILSPRLHVKESQTPPTSGVSNKTDGMQGTEAQIQKA